MYDNEPPLVLGIIVECLDIKSIYRIIDNLVEIISVLYVEGRPYSTVP